MVFASLLCIVFFSILQDPISKAMGVFLGMNEEANEHCLVLSDRHAFMSTYTSSTNSTSPAGITFLQMPTP